MLKIKEITLTQFKNYQEATYSLNRVVGISGLNGVGKTNLLDAIYYCCFTRSYFSLPDSMNVRFDQTGFRLQAIFEKGGEEKEVVCIYRGGNKKEFYLDKIAYERFSRHIGLLPVVIISPDDIELIISGSEERRKYLDAMLGQTDLQYLDSLITYNKVLQQRNSLLKQINAGRNLEILDILDKQLLEPGKVVYEKRSRFMDQLIPLVKEIYRRIAGTSEEISMFYTSQLQKDNFREILALHREKDILHQRSTAGIHKDDLAFKLNGNLFKQIASQGQRKSLLFALKLAEYEVIKNNKGFSPILLLDDVFEKLDDNRMGNLLKWVCKENDGQVIITDTHKQRLQEAFVMLGVNGQVIELE